MTDEAMATYQSNAIEHKRPVRDCDPGGQSHNRAYMAAFAGLRFGLVKVIKLWHQCQRARFLCNLFQDGRGSRMRFYVAMETPITNNLNRFQSFGQKSVSNAYGSYKQNMPASCLC